MNWLAALPYVFQLLGWILSRYNASQDTMRAFQALVQASKDDGLISVNAKDEFKKQKDELDKPH